MKISRLLAVAAVAISLTACTQNGEINKAAVGSVTGAVAGGVIGNQIGGGSGKAVATIAGSIAGAFIGGSIGNSLDQLDKMKFSNAMENAKTGQAVAWTNPDSHARYTVTPTRTVMAQNNQPCREYTFNALVGGKQQEVYGMACRQADGSWKIQS